MQNPGVAHWAALKRILRYLVGTVSLGLQFDGSQSIELTGFSDADWAGDIDTRRSTTGYVFNIGGAPISWSSRRQQTTALSTMEAEYMALAAAVQEAVWLRRLLGEFGLQKESRATCIQEDNQACIKFAKDPKDHSRAKHVDIKYHFVREMVDVEEISVVYCPTDLMVADLLTKSIPAIQFRSLLYDMGMRTTIGN